jgi:hypothetical protein
VLALLSIRKSKARELSSFKHVYNLFLGLQRPNGGVCDDSPKVAARKKVLFKE